ncbi:hypothetical protein CROQUDRAFT_92626 [Cronartium quercuum f. sp. fusiforme G11]|uniref:Uncharacterized protein n=1 Tax=Cronartium quercuum f. sp. fusiforme G11 TaxID=708437 RepID=A0A9P6NIA4_9BASI|nr:hypothetical protein CROQUDRAFT_92626 [Cronartium quercuum f. sp. fusiforme G11]
MGSVQMRWGRPWLVSDTASLALFLPKPGDPALGGQSSRVQYVISDAPRQELLNKNRNLCKILAVHHGPDAASHATHLVSISPGSRILSSLLSFVVPILAVVPLSTLSIKTMPPKANQPDPNLDKYFILVRSGENAGKWSCKLCQSWIPFTLRSSHCRLDKHRQLVAKEHEKKTPHGPGLPPGIHSDPQSQFSMADMEALGFTIPHGPGLPPGIHSNPQSQFSMADMEALGFTIPVGQGTSQDLGLEINNQHQDNTDGFEIDNEYNTMSDASNFRHALEEPDRSLASDSKGSGPDPVTESRDQKWFNGERTWAEIQAKTHLPIPTHREVLLSMGHRSLDIEDKMEIEMEESYEEAEDEGK